MLLDEHYNKEITTRFTSPQKHQVTSIWGDRKDWLVVAIRLIAMEIQIATSLIVAINQSLRSPQVDK